MKLWFEFTWKTRNHDIGQDKVNSQIIWCNSYIRIGNKLLLISRACENGLMYVNDILDYAGKLLSYEQVLIKYPDALGVMDYNSIVSAIPKKWLKEDIDTSYFSGTPYEKLSKVPKPVKVIYESINSSRVHHIATQYEKFSKHVNLTYEEYSQAYSDNRLLTKVTKFRDFQYRLLANAIHTNDQLYHWKIVDTKICEYCKEKIQTPVHLFA